MELNVYKRITEKAQLAKRSAYPLKPHELYGYLEQSGSCNLSHIRFLPLDRQGSLVGAQHYLSSGKTVLEVYAVPSGMVMRAAKILWETGLPVVVDWLYALEQAEGEERRGYHNVLVKLEDGAPLLLQNTALYI